MVQYYDRRAMWDSLIDHVPPDNPAIVCGDFNNILNPEERVGGLVSLEREVHEFFDIAASKFARLSIGWLFLYMD